MTVGWLALPADICLLCSSPSTSWRRDPELQPIGEILTANPGAIIDRNVAPTVWFKGGAECRVLAGDRTRRPAHRRRRRCPPTRRATSSRTPHDPTAGAGCATDLPAATPSWSGDGQPAPTASARRAAIVEGVRMLATSFTRVVGCAAPVQLAGTGVSSIDLATAVLGLAVSARSARRGCRVIRTVRRSEWRRSVTLRQVRWPSTSSSTSRRRSRWWRRWRPSFGSSTASGPSPIRASSTSPTKAARSCRGRSARSRGPRGGRRRMRHRHRPGHGSGRTRPRHHAAARAARRRPGSRRRPRRGLRRDRLPTTPRRRAGGRRGGRPRRDPVRLGHRVGGPSRLRQGARRSLGRRQRGDQRVLGRAARCAPRPTACCARASKRTARQATGRSPRSGRDGSTPVMPFAYMPPTTAASGNIAAMALYAPDAASAAAATTRPRPRSSTSSSTAPPSSSHPRPGDGRLAGPRSWSVAQPPHELLDVRYDERAIPGYLPEAGLAKGSTCQRYAYTVLKHFGIVVPPSRASCGTHPLRSEIVDATRAAGPRALRSGPRAVGAHAKRILLR